MHELAAVETMVKVALAKAEEVGSPRVVGMHFCIKSLHVTGVVQGVGFRPFVYTLAERLALTGREAAIVGRVVTEHRGLVTARTGIGGTRVVDVPAGELLPRIC